MDTNSIPYQKGYDAGYANSPISNNPYEVGTRAYTDYKAGWYKGNSLCMESLATDDMYTSY